MKIVYKIFYHQYNNSDCQGIICQKHNKKFEYFCKECFIHSCNEINEGNLNNGCDLIRLEEIRFDNKKIELLKNKIKPNIEEINENISNLNDTNTIINNNRNTELLTGKEKNQFNKLINIIINDYNNFPNILHFFNIQNLFNFFNIKDENEKEINSKNDFSLNREFNQNDEISIEYINNISDTTKLFHKTFVKNNKDNVYLQIEGENLELKTGHKFKSTEKTVTIKLIIKKNVINMYKMFANCINLISLDGISKFRKTKVINISKMFYNCTSLSSIIDIKDWDISL